MFLSRGGSASRSLGHVMQFLIDQLLAKRHILALVTLLLGGVVTWGATKTSLDSTFDSIMSEADPDLEEVEQEPAGTRPLASW